MLSTELPSLQELATAQTKLSLKNEGRKRRQRTSKEQLLALNKLFETNPLPTSQQRQELGAAIGMSSRSVQVWFQNKRQNLKKIQASHRNPISPLSSSSGSSRHSQSPEASRKGSLLFDTFDKVEDYSLIPVRSLSQCSNQSSMSLPSNVTSLPGIQSLPYDQQTQISVSNSLPSICKLHSLALNFGKSSSISPNSLKPNNTSLVSASDASSHHFEATDMKELIASALLRLMNPN